MTKYLFYAIYKKEEFYLTAKTKRFLSACIALLMAFTAMNMAFVQANAAEECTHSKVWKIDYEATEDHDGQMSFYCTKCNEVFESKKFTRHAHTEGYKNDDRSVL